MVQFKKRWDFECDDDNDIKDRISTNRTDKSRGDDGGGDKGRGHRAVTAQNRAQRSGEMGIIGRYGREFRPLGEGGFVPAEVAAEDPPLWQGSPSQGLG